jgi:hypothetical protein
MAATAVAKETRVVESVFGSGELSLSTNSGVGIDDVTHEVYVADTGNGKVAEFEADGTPVRTFGAMSTPTFLAVDNSGGVTQGAVYVVDAAAGKVLKFGGDGTPESTWATAGTLGGFGTIAGIAVDNDGSLYVLEESSTVHIFGPDGAEEKQFTAPRGTAIAGLAIDSQGDLYKVDGTPEVTKFNDSEETLSNNLTGREDASGLAVDSSDDDLYVLNGNGGAPFVTSFEVDCGERCASESTFGEAELTGSLSGVAVDASADHVYVADVGADQIKDFGPPVVVPDAVALAATTVKPRGATLNGSVNPLGLAVSECKFEYQAEGSPAVSIPCEAAIPTDESPHPVEATISGLDPRTTYTVRLVARNANGSSTSDPGIFTTIGPATTEPPTAVTATGATLNGVVAPEGEALAECVFEYGLTEENLTSTAPCTGATPPDHGFHPVAAAISGLQREAIYYYRLKIVQPGGEALGAIVSFETAGAHLRGEANLEVGTEEALLGAEIDPRGSATSYFLEYGSSAAFGQQTPSEAIGSGTEFQAVTQELTGLTSGATYHWRLVVQDEFGVVHGATHEFTTLAPGAAPETDCPNQVFRVGLGAFLPDCRAYEQATPVDKLGSNALGVVNYTSASASGDRITFSVAAGLPTTGGSSKQPVYLASRSAGGWSSDGTLPFAEPGNSPSTLGWDEEIDRVVSSSKDALTVNDTGTGEFRAVLASSSTNLGSGLDGFAEDPEHFIFQSKAALVQGAVSLEGRSNLYAEDHGALTLVGRIPQAPATECDDAASGNECVPAPEGSFAGPYDWQSGESVNKNRGGNDGTDSSGSTRLYYTRSAISRDGSRVFFTTAGSAQLYLREDGSRTTQISASERTPPDPNGPRPAAFLEATPDGSKVFFLSCEKLTDDSTAVSDEADSCTEKNFAGRPEQGQDLYSYDTATRELTDLSVDPNHADPLGAEVVGFLGASADGSKAYFVANGVLASNATQGDCRVSGVTGSCNLYLWSNGVVTFVARLSGQSDNLDWLPGLEPSSAELAGKESRVSPSGALLFGATESLTGYDNELPEGGQCRAQAGPLCREFFLYDPADTGNEMLRCITCDPSGSLPTGSAALASSPFALEGRPLFAPPLTRNLSPDADRVFFSTPDRLLAADTNGVTDAYEWEADGTGSCRSSAASGGCFYLLSSGTSPNPSYFEDASLSGEDAFVLTSQPLVGADDDQAYDMYDARVGGGLASQQAVSPQEPCSGEVACRAAATSPPSPASAGTSTFAGPGNQPPPPQCSKKQKKQKKCRGSKKKNANSGHKKKHKGKTKGHTKGHGASRKVRTQSDRGGSK